MVGDLYIFESQLIGSQLISLTRDKNKKWSQKEVSDLIRNTIITEAYIQGNTLTLVINDINMDAVVRVGIDYGKDIYMDRGEYFETPGPVPKFFYPKTILAYARPSDFDLELLSKNGVFSQCVLDVDFASCLEKELIRNGAIKLDKVYGNNAAEKLLVAKGIRTVLK